MRRPQRGQPELLDGTRSDGLWRHSAATHLGEQGIPLRLIMAMARHRNRAPRCDTSAQVPKLSLKLPACPNFHADEAEQYLPTLRPVYSLCSLPFVMSIEHHFRQE